MSRRPSTLSAAPATPRGGPAVEPALPPRPRVTSDLVPPRPDHRPARPRALGAAASFWTASFVAALIAFVAAYSDRATTRDRLTEIARANDPSLSPATLADGVRLTMVTVLAASALLVVLAAVCLPMVLHGKRGFRTALVGIAVLTLLVIQFDQEFVAGGVEVDRLALLSQGALVLVGTIALLLRPSGAWLRTVRR